MKKHLLFASVALLGVASAVNAQDPNSAIHSTNLTLEWWGVPTGVCSTSANARAGIGVNGKFYVAMQNKGVAIFNKDGQIKTIDNASTWVSINCDDAGHVYFRNDKGGWAGPEGAGWYLSDNARFCVIDTKTDEVIKSDVPMKGAPKCRFDAIPHILGDMVNDFIEIPITANAVGNTGYEMMYDQLEQLGGDLGKFDIGTELKKGGFPAPANVVQTLGLAQLYAPDADGIALKMAVLANNHVDVTNSFLKGWGNNVAVYEFNDELNGYAFSGNWLNTPSHSGVGGYCMFSYDDTHYICYPAGTTQAGAPSGDGFFVMAEELVDTPKNLTYAEDPEDWNVQVHKATAYKYATDGIANSEQNYRGINVEPVAGQDGVFTIYNYNPGKSMEVWTLDLAGSAGIDDIVADTAAAKIFGGLGVVVVDGAENAQVYSLAGSLVAEGNGQIAVPAGVYVVKADTTVAKVIVK